MNILQIKIIGIKSIDKEITINFTNKIIDHNHASKSNIKGIFGYNGSGKTAIITAVAFYKRIVTEMNFLSQNNVKEELAKLINFKTRKFDFSIVYDFENLVIKHYIALRYQDLTKSYCIKKEEISELNDRSVDGKYRTIIANENGNLIIGEKQNNEVVEIFEKIDLENTSIVPSFVKNIINKKECSSLENLSKTFLKILLSAENIFVDQKNTYSKTNSKLNRTQLISFSKSIGVNQLNEIDYIENYGNNDELVIDKNDLEKLKIKNKRLERFIKYFKPDLVSIDLATRIDHDFVHINRVFNYPYFSVEYKYESSGIKELSNLFDYLSYSVDGGAVFIDEIDANINTAYLKTLISFIINNAKGQLVFTSHNLETMNVLKHKSKSILILGNNNQLDVWTMKGNRSPVNDYLNGNILNSPMNLEDFDFINIFLGEI